MRMLLVSVSVLNRTSSNSLSNDVYERLYLDQIGESFVNSVKNGTHNDWDDGDADYTATVNGMELTLKDSQGNIKLSIKMENYQGGYKITQWKYN